MHAPGQALQGAHRHRHAADLREKLLRFPRRAVAHHHQPELSRRPRQVVVDETQAVVDRHQRCPARTVAVARTPVGHRTERGHDRLRCFRHPEPILPTPLDPGRTAVPVLDGGAQDFATEGVHGLAHLPLALLEGLGRRLRSKLLATESNHLSGRLANPGRQAAKIDGRGRRGLGYSHGDAPDAGFHTARYLTASCGAERSHLPPARPCRRDRILAWNGGLSRKPAFGCPSRPPNRAKSMAYVCHARPTPYPTVQIHVLHPRPLKTESITLMEFYSGQPDILAASVRDYCTGVLTHKDIERR